ncbi:Abi family protein [Ligilactobacillus aviarius]|uniref:Abi family protein n=1 Tax=Ligilactobacillus aviarius TaxID=1606 RepID=UPI0024B8D6BF|nr:Abi family protein [Ligilactobacillus aviarius]
MLKKELDKPFMPIDEQINQLKNDRRLLFQSEELAKKELIRYGYYEIINGYKEHFMVDESDDSKGFKDNVTFDHIFALFNLDTQLRKEVMACLELFEANLRQVLSYTVAEQISDNQDGYLKRYHYNTGRKFYNKRKKKYCYPIDSLLNKLKRTTKSNNEPFKHYRDEHDNIPPWIIVKDISFGNLIWWFRLLKRNEKHLVISRMMNLPLEFIDNDISRMVGSILDIYLNYRNTAAHGGRIYNHKSSKHKLPYIEILHKQLNVNPAMYRQGYGQSRFGTLLKTLSLFENQEPYLQLCSGVKIVISRYLKLYPQDKKYLIKKMELELLDK